MGSHKIDTTGIIAGTPRKMPQPLKLTALGMVVLGILAAGYGMATDIQRFRQAFIFNYAYFISVAQGGIMLSVAMTLVKARWGRPLRRFSEGLSLFVPILLVLFILFVVTGGTDIYPWMHEEMPAHKAVWLQPGFWAMRQVVGLGILSVLGLSYIRASLRADLGVAGAQLGSAAPAWWARLTGGWQGAEVEVKAAVEKQARLAPAIAVLYALVMSMVAVDIEMSLAPHWYANMFPAWFFMSSFWSGLVWIALLSMMSKSWLGTDKLLTGSVYHDLGKLTFGLTMFWGYTTFATYLAIWYGNMTEEIGFILIRTQLEPWASVSKVVFVLCFGAPFTMLLSRGLKKIPVAYMTVASIIAIGLWLERFITCVPSVWMKDTLPMGPIEIGMGLGLLGGLLLTVFGFLTRVPPIPVADPFLGPDPEHVHVLPASQAHAH